MTVFTATPPELEVRVARNRERLVLDRLRHGRALIASGTAWTTGVFARDADGVECPPFSANAKCWCAMGAVRYDHVGEAASDCLDEAAAGLFGGDFVYAATVNDKLGHAATLAMFDAAIDNLTGFDPGAPVFERPTGIDPVLDGLRAARALIASGTSWCIDYLAINSHGDAVTEDDPRAVAWCALGAKNHVAYRVEQDDVTAACEIADAAGHALYRAAVEAGAATIAALNDDPKQGHPAVLRAYDAAIERCRAELLA